jgi:Na+/melibiose symporter-like transporter
VPGYGLLGLPLAFAALPIYVHLPRLYGDSVGVPLALLGGVLFAARLADALVDPWLGALTDRPGLRRPAMTLALVPFASGLLALFNPPEGSGIAWLAAALSLTYLSFSLLQVAYCAWGADIGGDLPTRTRLTAAREGWGLVGVLLAAALPGMLSSDFATGLSRLSWLFPLLLLAAAAVSLAAGHRLEAAARAAREVRPAGARPPAGEETRTTAPHAAPDAPAPLRQRLAAALAEPAFRRLLAVFALSGVASALPATLVLFFIADVLKAEAWSGLFLTLYFAAGLAGLPFWVRHAARRGPLRAWRDGMLLACAAFALAPGLGAGDLVAFGAVCILSGLALGADLALPAAHLAQLTDRPGAPPRDGRPAGGLDSGSAFGVWNLVAKLNLALAAGIALPLLDWSGYRPGAEPGALALLYGALPLAGKLAAAVLLTRWHDEMHRAAPTANA